MHDTIFAKTEAGRRALQERSFSGTRAQRSLLIMIDGMQPLGKLWPAVETLGLNERDVEHLAQCGYIEGRAVMRTTPRAAAAATPAAESSRPVQRSLAAAKFYALDQVGRLLGRADEELRLAARTVTDRTSLITWLEHCQRHIADVAGEERAGLFAARVLDLLPEEAPA